MFELNEEDAVKLATKGGGPVFPIIAGDKMFQGATLRDYFAAKALSTVPGYATTDLEGWTPHDFAVHAYSIADAMLAERAK